jgi:ADP-ribosylglycohydrolase
MDNYIGTLLAGCCGDVLGSQTEGMTFLQIKEKYPLLGMPENKLYTDDTEMTLVLARHISKHQNIITIQLHKEYANEIKDKGYSSTTRSILKKIKDDVGEFIPEGKSDHNGCVMRISPLGLINLSTEDLIESIKLATLFTHGGNEDSVFCCFIHCKLINSLINRKFAYFADYFNYIFQKFVNTKFFTKINIVKFCLNYSTKSITEELLGHCDIFQIKAIDAICCAYYIFFRNYQKPKEAIIEAATLGGDTDTIAKLVGDLCGAYYGYEWIPEDWYGVEGQSELIELGKNLYTLYN